MVVVHHDLGIFFRCRSRKDCIIGGILNSEAYCRILDTHLAPSVKKLKLKNYFTQQDTDPKHTSKCTRDYLKDKNY